MARRCGLKEIFEVIRVRRLQWFGDVKRREEGEALLVEALSRTKLTFVSKNIHKSICLYVTGEI